MFPPTKRSSSLEAVICVFCIPIFIGTEPVRARRESREACLPLGRDLQLGLASVFLSVTSGPSAPLRQTFVLATFSLATFFLFAHLILFSPKE